MGLILSNSFIDEFSPAHNSDNPSYESLPFHRRQCAGFKATIGGHAPIYSSNGASGADIKACLSEKITIHPGCREMIPTGLILAIPRRYDVQIRPIISLAYINGVHAIVGTIDSDYRDEVKVLLMNNSLIPFEVEDGMIIAQLVCSEVITMNLNHTLKEDLDN